MKYFVLFVIAYITSVLATPAQVIIIPNGEIDSSGNLTQQGLERAGALADYITLTPNFTSFGQPLSIFAARPTNAIAQNTQCCIQTVSPTAQLLGLPIHSGYSTQQNSSIASFILNDPKYNGKTVLICWRSDSIQALGAALGVSSPPTFASGNNQTWLITFSSGASLQVLPQDLLSSDNTTLSGCGSVPYPSNTGYLAPEPITESPQVWSFVSEPNLHPMKITVNTLNPGVSTGSIFVAPYAFSSDSIYGQPGSFILANNGDPVWCRPLSSTNLMNTDFRVQSFNGNLVLTFWQGTLATPPAYTNAPGGSSEPCSCYYILDNTYATIKTVSAQNGFTSDIHEFLLTPSNTALFLSTKTVPMDLTPYGGPSKWICTEFCNPRSRSTNKQPVIFLGCFAEYSSHEFF